MFLHTDVGKDGLDDAQPSGVNTLALIGVDLGFHLIDQVGRLGSPPEWKDPARCGGLAQTACLPRTGGAVFHTGMVDIIGAVAVDLVAGMAGQFLPLRTAIHLLVRIEREVRSGEESWLGVGSLPAWTPSLKRS